MKNSPFQRYFLCLLIGLLGMLLISPLGVQAKVEIGIGADLGDEGDPLDSNDYSSGGGGTSDNDIHDSYTAPPSDSFLLTIIQALKLDRLGRMALPTIHNGVPMIQVIDFSGSNSAAGTNAD